MSRLDWFTILIVSVCVVALGFLVYKTFQLMGNNQAAFSRTELATANGPATDASTYQSAGEAKTTESDDQDPDDDELTYDPEEVEAPEEKKTAPVATTKKAPVTEAAKSSATKTKAEVKTPTFPNSKTTAKGDIPSNYSTANGTFMVVAGSFSQRFNADNQVARLKRLGFKNAKVEIFNGGAVATALVDRFDSRSHADQLVKALKAKGVDSFVKRKQ